MQTMLILGLRQPNPSQGSNFWHIPAAYARDTLEEAAELVIRVMKHGDVYFDEDEDLAEKLDITEDAPEQEDPGARPGAFDEAAAEYAAEQAAGRRGRGGEAAAGAFSAPASGLDELDMLEQRLASRKEAMEESSSDDDDADELRAAMADTAEASDSEQEAGGRVASGRTSRPQKQQKSRKHKSDKQDKKEDAAKAAAAAAAAAAELRQARAAKAAKAAEESRAAEHMQDDVDEPSQLTESPAAAKKRTSSGSGRLAKRRKLRAEPTDVAVDSEDDLDLGLDDGLDLDSETESADADTGLVTSAAPAAAAPVERNVGGRRAAMMVSSKCRRRAVPACPPARLPACLPACRQDRRSRLGIVVLTRFVDPPRLACALQVTRTRSLGRTDDPACQRVKPTQMR